MRSSLYAVVVILLAMPFARACLPECHYASQCADGGSIRTCFVGVDSCVGDPLIKTAACDELNPTCVTLDDENALCVKDPGEECVEHCEGTVGVECQEGFAVRFDCAESGMLCGSDPQGGVRCVQPS
jgi:hypothetical protein